MSSYLAWVTIQQLITTRTILTFSVTGQLPVGCLFVDNKNSLVLDTLDHFLSNGGNVGRMMVFNPSTQAIESLDTSLNLFLVFSNGYQNQFYAFGFTGPSSTPAKFQILRQGTLVWMHPTLGIVAPLAYCTAASLVFCVTQTNCPQSITTQLLNFTTLANLVNNVGAVSDAVTKCCSSDVPTIIGFFLSITGPLVQYSDRAFPTLSACEDADTTCKCPTLKTCWMYNSTTVPCCIQGNPSDVLFEYDQPLITTKIQSECTSAATNCSKWSFHPVDVPCCVQRSLSQWNAQGYSDIQMFDNKQACDNAAASSCTLKAFLYPPTNLRDYYGLLLESQYTSGCEPLRTAGRWGNSSTLNNGCASDPSPQDCYSGNCDNNYCKPWAAISGNPYSFTQSVRCLPPADVCCGNKSQIISDNGKPTVTATCKE